MSDLTLVIPAKYESESLPLFLEELKDYKFKKLIILEENDLKTINAIKKFSDIKILFQKIKGYGSAIIEGVKIVDTNFFCIINADGSMNPTYIEIMLNKLVDNKLDFVFASRYEKPGGGSDDDDLITLVGNYFFTKFGKIFFKLNISDILFTYILGKTALFNEQNFSSNDFTLCVEMPITLKRNKCKLDTIPSFERSRIGGKKKVKPFRDGLLILFKMLKMLFLK